MWLVCGVEVIKIIYPHFEVVPGIPYHTITVPCMVPLSYLVRHSVAAPVNHRGAQALSTAAACVV